MKAVLLRGHGDIDVLSLENVATPRLLDGEVLVRVGACGVNASLDVRTRRGDGGRAITLPRILGADIAGEVVEVSSEGDSPWLGKRVLVFPWITCGKCSSCLRGEENTCDTAKTIGIDRDGGYAELVAVPSDNLIELPDGLEFSEAAALPVAYGTAWRLLVTRGQVQAGETVLVVGATGGVGTALIDIARSRGARVIATSSSAPKRQQLREIGAEAAIDFSDEFGLEEIARLTDGNGVDIVCELVGKSTWSNSLAALRSGGRLLCCGSPSGGVVELTLREMYRKALALHFSMRATRGEIEAIVSEAGAGRLRPVVGAKFPLSESGQAQLALSDRSAVGKVVLLPGLDVNEN